ncbi:MAG: protoporphyrinogen oxidase [Rhodoglobus sp.]
MNPRLIMLGLGVGLGYILGTRDGRERYDAMKKQWLALWENPRVARARKDLEDYARQQAPIIRERAEAAAKAAPGVAKDVAEKVGTTAKDVAGQVSTTARDVADKAASTARDVADKATATAKDVADKVRDVATDLRDQGGILVDSAVTTAGQARDWALDELDDEDDAKP